jgi:hypothetical protein
MGFLDNTLSFNNSNAIECIFYYFILLFYLFSKRTKPAPQSGFPFWDTSTLLVQTRFDKMNKRI